jgi:hypothetical protein
MTRTADRSLYWAPRLLSIAYIVFISLFALDSAGVAEFAVHMIPSMVLIAMLAVSWRLDAAGALLFGVAALWYASLQPEHPTWVLTISGPLVVIALLFLANWRIHAHRAQTPA